MMDQYIEDIKVGKNEYIDKIIDSNKICIFYGPPAAGKDSIVEILAKDEDKERVLRTSTREKNSVETVDYHYVNRQDKDFETIRNNAVVSYRFHNNYYWDDAREIYRIMNDMPDSVVILSKGTAEGVRLIKNILKNAITICVIPTSKELNEVDECIWRIKSRNRDHGERLSERIEIIRKEIDLCKSMADFILENPRDGLQTTVEKARKILHNFKKRL